MFHDRSVFMLDSAQRAWCCRVLQVQQLVRADQLMGRLSRVAAAISLRTNDPLTESGHDSVAGLRHYYGTVASTNVTLSWQVGVYRSAAADAGQQQRQYQALQQHRRAAA